MDPLTHTLAGAALAQTGLGRRSRFGATALVVSAILPDIDALTYFLDGDVSLYLRRGWTHGVVALVALPLVVTGALLLLGRIRKATEPIRSMTLFWLSFLAMVTHLGLDWLNTYGVRWLMPLSDRWFYGDAVSIVDPWIWLVLGAAVFLTASRTRIGIVAWAFLAICATFLLFQATDSDLWVAKAVWLVGLALAIGFRARNIPGSLAGKNRLATGAITWTCVYIGLMIFSSRYARHQVIEELHRSGIEYEEIMVGSVAVTPFVRDVVVATPDHYRYGTLRWTPGLKIHLEEPVLPKPSSSPVIQEALRSPEVRGLVNWIRFPFIEVEETQTSHIVTIMDARYTRRRNGGRGFGRAQVVIPKDRAGGS